MDNETLEKVKKRMEELRLDRLKTTEAIASAREKKLKDDDDEVTRVDIDAFLPRLAKHTFKEKIKAHGATKREAYKKYFNKFKKDFYSMPSVNRRVAIRQGLYILGELKEREPQGVVVNGKVVPANVGRTDA